MNLGDVPDVVALATATAELLRQGPDRSERMRQRLALAYGIDPSGSSWPRFVNNHAWALVRLQARGTIRKAAPGRYQLAAPDPDGGVAPEARAGLPPPDGATRPIRDGAPLPPWARRMVGTASRKNAARWQAAPFTEGDLRALWDACGGRCTLTGLPFEETQLGTGAARKPYAPSLDRIDAASPYTRGDCRLVLQVVNFALNSYGDEVFDRITAAAVGHRRGAGER